jgi:3D (Asp-Asp-Asp) domain-containing protein
MKNKLYIILALVFFFLMCVEVGRMVSKPVPIVETRSSAPVQSITITTISPKYMAEKPDEPTEKIEKRYLGEYTITAYCNGKSTTGKDPGDPGYGITSSGAETIEGITAACNSLPEGCLVEIEGLGYRSIVDKVPPRIDAYYDHKLIDVFFEDYEACVRFGVKRLKVWEILEA